MEESKSRSISLDILKTLGILMIIIAHSNAPDLVVQIRSFDVPLLVMISGILGVKSYTKSKQRDEIFITKNNKISNTRVDIFINFLYRIFYTF